MTDDIKTWTREELGSAYVQRELQLKKALDEVAAFHRVQFGRMEIDDLILWFRNEDRSLPIDEVGHAIDVFAKLLTERDALRAQVAKLEQWADRACEFLK